MSNALRNKVQAEKDFDIIESSANACRLFALVTVVCNKVSIINHLPTKMMKSLALMMKSSGNDMGLSDFYDRFLARRKAREVSGLSFDSAVLQDHMLSVKLTQTGGDKTDPEYVSYLAVIDTTSNEQFYAYLFLCTAGDHYEECQTTLENNFTTGSDMIPITVEDAYTLLEKFLKSKGLHQKQSSGGTNHDNNVKARMLGHSFQ